MTSVAFHFNAADRLQYTCRLVRKAVGAGAKLVVIGQRDALEQLDQALWQMSATEFVPHAGVDAGELTKRRSPILLAESLQALTQCEVLVNLGEAIPDGFDRFDRVIEVVGLEEQDKRLARLRWRGYSTVGLDLVRHDLSQKVFS